MPLKAEVCLVQLVLGARYCYMNWCCETIELCIPLFVVARQSVMMTCLIAQGI